jgi:hypothetical protein
MGLSMGINYLGGNFEWVILIMENLKEGKL